jgi:hypothetical protein
MNIARMAVQPKGQPKATPEGGGEATNGEAAHGEAGSPHSFATALQNAHESNPKNRKDPHGARNSYPALDAQIAAQAIAMQPVPAADAAPPPTSLSMTLQLSTNAVDTGTSGGGASASASDVRDVLDAKALQGDAGGGKAGAAVVSDFAMLASLPPLAPATEEAAPAPPAATDLSRPALPSLSPSAAAPAPPQPSVSPTKLDAAATKTRPASPPAVSPPAETASPLADDKHTPASPNARLDAPSAHGDATPARNETPKSHPNPYSARAENRTANGSSSYASTAAAADRTAKTGGARATSDPGDDTDATSPAAAAAPGPVALEAVHSLPHASDNANVVTAVNGSSPEVKAATGGDAVASTGAAVSAANQAVIRRAAGGEIHVPELGRVAVRAEGAPNAVNVDISVDRAETHAALHASAGALAADLRQADVPLGHLRFDRGNAHGAPGDSGTGYGTSSHDTPRDSHSSADHDEADDAAPMAAAGRVRIVL